MSLQRYLSNTAFFVDHKRTEIDDSNDSVFAEPLIPEKEHFLQRAVDENASVCFQHDINTIGVNPRPSIIATTRG